MKDLTGQRFGRLVAIRPTESYSRGGVMWLCQCDCGKRLEVLSAFLSSTKSCGCLRDEKTSKRDRERWGEKNPRHKLTADQVNDIRHRYAAGFITQKELGREYHVSASHISCIVTGKTWKRLPDGPIMKRSPVTNAPKIRQRRRISKRNESVSMSKK